MVQVRRMAPAMPTNWIWVGTWVCGRTMRTHVPTQIQLVGIAGAIRRTWTIHTPDGIVYRAPGPMVLPRVIPFPRLARKAQFQIVVRLERHKPTQASAAARVAVQIRHRIVRPQTHVPTQIQLVGIAGAIRRTWPIHTPDGIVYRAPGLAQRHSP